MNDKVPPIEPYSKIELHVSKEEADQIDQIPTYCSLNKKFCRILWATNRYDGPLDGYMLWNGKNTRFECSDYDVIVRKKWPSKEYLAYQKREVARESLKDGIQHKWDEEDYTDYDEFRIFEVFSLTDDEWRIASERYAEFVRCIGDYPYGLDGKRDYNNRIEPTASEEERKNYWDKWKAIAKTEKFKKEDHKVVGTFKM